MDHVSQLVTAGPNFKPGPGTNWRDFMLVVASCFGSRAAISIQCGANCQQRFVQRQPYRPAGSHIRCRCQHEPGELEFGDYQHRSHQPYFFCRFKCLAASKALLSRQALLHAHRYEQIPGLADNQQRQRTTACISNRLADGQRSGRQDHRISFGLEYGKGQRRTPDCLPARLHQQSRG